VITGLRFIYSFRTLPLSTGFHTGDVLNAPLLSRFDANKDRAPNQVKRNS
jgi:hypothetical protein